MPHPSAKRQTVQMNGFLRFGSSCTRDAGDGVPYGEGTIDDS